MDLKRDGYMLVSNFVNSNFLKTLNHELDSFFPPNALTTINGSKGALRYSKNGFEIPLPFVSIRNTNLLDFVNSVYTEIGKNGVNIAEYYLSEFHIFSDNETEAFGIHSDISPDSLLAICYIKGGGLQSGGSIYLPGSHINTYTQTTRYLDENSHYYINNKIDLTGNPGDLIVYNLNGYHSRHISLSERRIIRITFKKKELIANKPLECDDFAFPASLLGKYKNNTLPDYINCHQYKNSDKIVPLYNAYENQIYYAGTKEILQYVIQYQLKRIKRAIFKRFNFKNPKG